MIALRVDPTRPEPLFQQLVDGVKDGVARGRLAAGDRLPSVRDLAKELVINPNTIAKAYRALEAEGVTYSRRGAGTFIAERRVVMTAEERQRRFREALEPLLADAVNQGMSEQELRRTLDEALRRFRFSEEVIDG